MKPVSNLLLCVSLFSFAICFPSDRINMSKSHPKEKVESRLPFRQSSYTASCQFKFLPEVFVLSLSSTSQSPKSDLDRDLRNNERKTNRNSNKITVKTVDRVGQELPLRTIEYRRRKHEWAERYTSQEGLREAFGSNRNRWWGDLDANTARRLYKRLLFPTAISELVLELGDEIVRPEELAPLAYEARKAAKMYVRERCRVPSRVGAYLFDGFRQLRKYGRFQPNGASYEQLWIRYYEENGSSSNNTDNEWEYLLGHNGDLDVDDDDIGDIMDGIDDDVTEEEIVKQTCQKILEKSCTTNEAIDRFYLKEYDVPAMRKEDNAINSVDKIEMNNDCDDDNDAENGDETVKGKVGRGQRWRNRKKRKDRYNDLLLEKITKTLERDVRKLLEPPSSSLSSSIPREGEVIYSNHDETYNQYDRHNSKINSEFGKKEGNLSSRRMTQQEYHSLKLFAKARKYSQNHQAKDNNSNSSAKSPSCSNTSQNVSVLTPVTITDRKTAQD